jgi:hypothetical protein
VPKADTIILITVKLGYIELGYHELPLMANKIFSAVGSSLCFSRYNNHLTKSIFKLIKM